MMTVTRGNIFTSSAQTLVNTVNCVGVMGAGLALECRLRWPDMNRSYVTLCESGQIDIGKLWLFKAPDRWILNFPTKRHWKDVSRPEFLEAGLQKFLDTYAVKGITSAAFPLLGAQHGKLSRDVSQGIMERYLSKCDIPIEIFIYDPMAHDDLYQQFRSRFLSQPASLVRQQTGLRGDFIDRVREALADTTICQLNQLAKVPGIGIKTLEKTFAFAIRPGTQRDLGL